MQRQYKYFLFQDKDMFTLHNVVANVLVAPGSQDICIHDIGLLLLEYSDFSTRERLLI